MSGSRFTLGVEEEYQVVDPDGWGLRDAAPEVLAADWTEDVRAEIHRSTIEVASEVCGSAGEAAGELRRMRTAAAVVSASVGLGIAAAGVHPFSRWEGRKQTEGRRYREIVRRFGRISVDEHNFGMHVHVGLEAGVDRIRILNGARAFLPHLLALSCSSPFYEGTDTGYSSYRMILWRRWPVASVPPRFESEEEYARFMDLFLRTSALPDPGTIYWSVRLHGALPTIELRVTDVCPRVDDATALAALFRALVVALARGILPDGPPAGISAAIEREVIATNEWRAARWGLDTRLVDPASASAVPVRDAVRRALERVGPVAESLGDGAEVRAIEGILERGNGADRMRRVFREQGSLSAVVAWLHAETLLGTGIDRRARQRRESI